MYYVYILQSLSNGTKFYVGSTAELKRRLTAHNRGDSSYTSELRPWILVSYMAFLSRSKAEEFEKYLKSRAGRRFQLRHFAE